MLAWHDVQQAVDAIVAIEPEGNRRTAATVAVEGSWSRTTSEGLRPVPREAVSRLRPLCQTAADL